MEMEIAMEKINNLYNEQFFLEERISEKFMNIRNKNKVKYL